jgi:hypothetical protein
MESKSAQSILEILQTFTSELNVTGIVSDEESALRSQPIIDYLISLNISLKLITKHIHTALGVTDKFIRTLHDMNKPTVKSSNTSENHKYRDFTVKRMNKLLSIYNTTVHTTTKHAPEEMKSNPELEVRYIIDKIYQVERRKKLVYFELKPGTWVRYILERIPGQKRRYKVSPEAYCISHKQGNAYVLMTADGSTKTVSRWRLFSVGDTIPSEMKAERTFGVNTGTISQILEYNS